MKVLPNFFLVGAARSGTTSLWRYLKENEQIFMPNDELYKEPAFFSPLKSSMSIHEYLNLFKGTGESHKLVGEASTAYLTDPVSAKCIYDFNPNAKIIIILRNPAERAYSLYNWMVQEGYEFSSTFEKALALEGDRIKKKIPNFFEPEYYYNYMYFNSGLYYEEVKRYLDLFSDNVLVAKFDDLKYNLSRTYERICSFLDIMPNTLAPETHNKSMAVYSPILQFLLRKISNHLVIINTKIFSKRIITKKSRDKLLKLGLRNRALDKIKEETKELLIKKYENDVKLLAELTNINFDDWIK